MNIDPIQKFTFNMENDKGQLLVKGEISGESHIPLLDDLKFNIIPKEFPFLNREKGEAQR